MKRIFLLIGMAAGLAFGTVPVGFDAQCGKQLWVTYRSFNKELERTGQFGAMGITNRCFFAANTINSGGAPYCEYPPIWKDFKRYDWSALDAQAGDLVKASPNARFMVMIDLNTPYWATHRFWLDSFTDVTHAASDPTWRARTKEWMLDFIAYAEKRWGDRIGCYILSGGGTSEWYEYDRGRTSRAKDRAWAAWCKKRGLDFGASVHFYVKANTWNDEYMPVFANERFLAVHSVKGGEKTIRLPRKVGCVTDLLTGTVIARDADSFTTTFATPDTRLFGLSDERAIE